MSRVTEATMKRRLGNNLYRLRREQRLTQEQVAERAEMNLRHYQRAEHGELNATLTTLAKLATAFDVAPAHLLERPPRR